MLNRFCWLFFWGGIFGFWFLYGKFPFFNITLDKFIIWLRRAGIPYLNISFDIISLAWIWHIWVFWVFLASFSSNLGTGFTRECIRFRENFAQCRETQQSSSDYLQVKLYTGGRWSSCCQDVPWGRSWIPLLCWPKLYLLAVGLGEERITEDLTALSFLIKAIFASSHAVVGLGILVAVYIN